MTVYFTASIIGKKYYLADYQEIIKLLQSEHYQVIADHIINSSSPKILVEKREERIRFQQQLEKWINACDFMVAETSYPSISVGYEISMALYSNKPVLILFRKGDPPSLLAHHKDENLVCEKYTKDSLPGIITDFTNYVKGKTATRFTFYITAEISHYLEEVATKHKIPKSVYLRKLIETDMRKLHR